MSSHDSNYMISSSCMSSKDNTRLEKSSITLFCWLQALLFGEVFDVPLWDPTISIGSFCDKDDDNKPFC